MSTRDQDNAAVENAIKADLAARLRNHFEASATASFDDLRQLYKSEAATTFTFHGRRPHGPETLMGIDEFLNELRTQRAEFPNTRIEILDITTTVDRVGGRAKQMLNYKVFGQPEGVVKTAVGIWRWVWERGEWKVQSINTLPGLGDLT